MSALTDTFTGIANAIRSKTGGSSTFTPAQMITEIENMPTGGSWINPNEYKESTITSYTGSENLILDNAFMNCSNLSEVSFPECEYIGLYAFYSCSSLSNISFPKCSYIGYYAFQNCSSLLEVSFHNISYIGNYAFMRCSGLINVSFPNVSSIGNGAFGYCYKLTDISFPECSYIGEFTFNYCGNLSTISFPKCTYIDNYAFTNCTSLSTILFPECSYIGYSAFAECTKLSEASFPMCKYIGSYAFASMWGKQCSNLSWLYLLSTSVATLASSNAFNSTPLSAGGTGFIYVPNDLVDTYKAATNWSYISNRIYPASIPDEKYMQSTITSYTGGELAIGTSTFANCTNLNNISFPNVSSIGSYAFYGCNKLTEAIFPNCEYIDNAAFFRCTSLTTISFPECSYIGNYAFSSCWQITIASFPECEYIGNRAFNDCTSLSSLYLLGSSVATLNNSYAFNGTPLAPRGTGTIYVPSSLYNDYITATNWSYLSARISSM